MVRNLIHIYPEITSKISESWQAGKWVDEVDYDELTLMWLHFGRPAEHHRHFYIKELAQLQDGQFIIPLRFVVYQSQDHVEFYTVTHDTAVRVLIKFVVF